MLACTQDVTSADDQYFGPAMVAEELANVCDDKHAKILDVGAGTGLVGSEVGANVHAIMYMYMCEHMRLQCQLTVTPLVTGLSQSARTSTIVSGLSIYFGLEQEKLVTVSAPWFQQH